MTQISICSSSHAVSQLQHTLLQRLQTLKGDLELVWIAELGWVVEDVDAQERYDRHLWNNVMLFVECSEWENGRIEGRAKTGEWTGKLLILNTAGCRRRGGWWRRVEGGWLRCRTRLMRLSAFTATSLNPIYFCARDNASVLWSSFPFRLRSLRALPTISYCKAEKASFFIITNC